MPDKIPRPLLFKYTALEFMASHEKPFIKFFRGANKTLDFRARADLVSKQIAALPDGTNRLTSHIPAMADIIAPFAAYFGVDAKQIPDQKLNILWYIGFMAKHISALGLPADRLYKSLNTIAMADNLQDLGSRCGYYEITSNKSSYSMDINDPLAGCLIYLNFYNLCRLADGRASVYLMTVLPNVKHLGIAFLNEAFLNCDGIVCLPRMTPKNCTEGLHSFISHDQGHSFMWVVQLLTDKQHRLLNQVYKLVNHYLIAHLVRYPEMQIFNLALVALFLIVHEENFISMQDVFQKTGSPIAPLLPNTQERHFHHMLFQRWLNQAQASEDLDVLRHVCENENAQCLETYETLVESRVDIFARPDLKSIPYTDRAEYKEKGFKFLQGMVDKTNQAFAAYNEVVEHALACTAPDGETYNTKLVRARLCL